MTRILANLLVLLAVLLMPLGMSSAASAAQTASHHDMAGIAVGHCPDEDSRPEPMPGIAACTMACSAALPAIEPVQPQRSAQARAPQEIDRVPILSGLHPEAATPPPKRT